jgi:hypothetical protein
MKKITLLFTALVFGFTANAQQVATLQSGGVTTIYTNTNPLIDAYNAAIGGDTILLSGGAFTTPSYIAKGVAIIGAGIGPDSTVATYPTLLAGNLNISNGADSLYVEGVQLTGSLLMPSAAKSDFVSFVRCHFLNTVDLKSGSSTRPVAATNWSFIQCVFQSSFSSNQTVNSLYISNIYQTMLYHSSSNTFQNNIFLHATGYGSWLFQYFNNNILSNNIFLFSSAYFTYSSASNLYQNNVFVSVTSDYGSTPIINGNYNGVNADSIFVNQSGSVFNWSHNYHLKASAAASYVGYDNTQVGVYGGFMPLREGWVPLNPHVSFKQIPGVTNNQGILNIQVKARAQQ